MAKKKGTLSKLGSWIFILGVIAAVVIGFVVQDLTKPITAALIIVGLIIGLLNIKAKETSQFLLAALALVIVAAFGRNILGVITFIGRILDAIMILIVPATVIVSLKTVYSLAKS
ncbi:hypothetical protein KY360_05810 [Candidatus Woesearchaeota archaeon]|nr:hypothetical protein [Candidatus Woesearchaeota archaeon]